MAKQRRRPQPPPGAMVEVEVVSVPKEGPIIVRFLGIIRGILTHWGKDSSVACPGADVCPTSTHRGRTLWKGYIAAEWWRGGQYQDWCPCAFEVTQRLGELMDGAELRGTVWTCRRQIGRGGVKEAVGEQTDEVDPDRLRQPFSVEPAVCRVFGTTRIAWDVEPYLPRPVVLCAAAGPAPLEAPQEGPEPADTGRSMKDEIRQHLIEGTLPDKYRLSLPKLVATVQAELDAAGRSPVQVPPAPPRPPSSPRPPAPPRPPRPPS